MAWAYAAASRAHARAVPCARALIPTVCVGSVVAGGSGKTPVAQALVRFSRALAEGAGGGPARSVCARPHVVCRGYGGREVGPLRVDAAAHGARRVGDEARLHAASAPTWVARSRLAGVCAAAAQGASVAILDDGLQHWRLLPDVALLVLRTPAALALGNGRALPAGPLRESPADALRRVDAVVILSDALEGEGTAYAAGAAGGGGCDGGVDGAAPRAAPDTPRAAIGRGALPLNLPAALEQLTTAAAPSADARALEAEVLRLCAPARIAGSGSEHSGSGADCGGAAARAEPPAEPPTILHAVLLPTDASRAALGGLDVVGFCASASPESFCRVLAGVTGETGRGARPGQPRGVDGQGRTRASQARTEDSEPRGPQFGKSGHHGHVHAVYAYPDHAHLEDSELHWLLARAAERGAALVSTSKDRARLPAWAAPRVLELEVRVAWERESAARLAAILTSRLLRR